MGIDDIIKKFCPQDKDYEDKIRGVHKKASDFLSIERINFPYFTSHNISHSERIFRYIEMILSTGNVGLRDNEKVILACAVFLHDVGMATTEFLQDEKKLKEKDFIDRDKQPRLSKKARAVLRDKHHIYSCALINRSVKGDDEFSLKAIEDKIPRITKYIAEVAKNHRQIKDFKGEIDYDVTIGGKEVRIRLLSALLCLGDAMDISYERIQMKELKQIKIPTLSEYHWRRCYCVDSITIDKKKQISVQCYFPEEYMGGIGEVDRNDIKYFGERIKRQIKDELDDQIEAVIGVLRDDGFDLYCTKEGYVKIDGESCNMDRFHGDLEKHIVVKLPLPYPPKSKTGKEGKTIEGNVKLDVSREPLEQRQLIKQKNVSEELTKPRTLYEIIKNPITAEDFFIRGVAAQADENNYKAIKHYEKAIEENPDYAEAYNNMGVAYYQ